MEDKIRLLPQIVANRIAAGEVVTHPASVIKEMMENSIDAGATQVIVNYRQAGYELIQIVDNGAGLSPNDARMAFERHATSKIRSEKDLSKLNTFGFRGEALASIAAVSKVELKSRMEGSEIGTITKIENGHCIDQKAEYCEKGANFLVRDIFQDTPARRRFMDKEAKSAMQLTREFRRVVLCYPDIAFELHNDGSSIYRLAPTTQLSRIVDVVGRSAKTSLLELKIDSSIVNIHGYIGNEKSVRKRNLDQYMFVNGRYFESKYFTSAILKGYENIIKLQYQPSYFIYFEVKADDVDVNIHPQKIEVNFAEKQAIWQILYAAVRKTLAQTGVVSMMSFDDSSDIEIPVIEHGKSYSEPRAISNESYNPFEIEAQIEAKQPKDDMDNGAANSFEFDEFESEHTQSMTSSAIGSTGSTGSAGVKGSKTTKGARSSASSIGAMQRRENIDISWESGFESGTTGQEGLDALTAWESLDNNIPETADDQIIVEYDNYESKLMDVESSGYDKFRSAALGSDTFGSERFVDESTAGESLHSDWQSIAESEPKECAELPITEPNRAVAQGMMGDVMVTNGRYGWCKIDGNMSVIDLKRAKERILYDHYSSTIKSAQTVSQRTFFPVVAELTTAEYTMLSDNIDEFHRAGFEISLMDDDTIEICGVPAGLSNEVARELIDEILHMLTTPEDVAESRRERIAMVMSQNEAKGIGKSISTQQATELITQLLKCQEGGRTADGRRIIWNVTLDDIKRKLK